MDSTDYKNPIKTKFDSTIIEPIYLNKETKFSGTQATIQPIDLKLLDSVYNPYLIEQKQI